MEEHGPVLKDLFHTDYFKINVVSDADTVELCGSLKVCSNQDTSYNKLILKLQQNSTSLNYQVDA